MDGWMNDDDDDDLCFQLRRGEDGDWGSQTRQEW
jgi:hypothetical protein